MATDMRMETPRRRPPRRFRSITVFVVCAVLLGVALTLQVKTWSALGTEAGGSCGTRRGPCPRGTAWMLPVSLITLFLTIPVTATLARRVAPRRLGWLGALLLAAVGVYPGLAVFAWGHGRSLKTVWAAPPDRPATVEGLGGWVSGSTVVRARFDGLVGYGLADGARRWTYTLPGRDVLCVMSRTAEGGVGLVGHGAESAPCARVTAVDLNTGRPVWKQALSTGVDSPPIRGDAVAVTGNTAVLGTSTAVRAVGLRDGARGWERKAPGGCRFDGVAAGGRQVLAEVSCTGAAPEFRALDAVTGRTRWTARAPIQGAAGSVSLLSASPAVVRVREPGRRGTDVIVAFDQTGRAGRAIEVDDGERRLEVDDQGFRAAPSRTLFVQDGLLVVKVNRDAGRAGLAAYDVSDGRLRWEVVLPRFTALAGHAGQAFVLGDEARHPDLWRVSLRDGKASYAGVTGFPWLTSKVMLYPSGGLCVVVTERATTPRTFPVAVIRTA